MVLSGELGQWGLGRGRGRGGLLAEAVAVFDSFALTEEESHALGHVDAEEHVEVADDGGETREEGGFVDGMVREITSTEGLRAQVPFYDELAVETTEDPQDAEKEKLEPVPIAVV